MSESNSMIAMEEVMAALIRQNGGAPIFIERENIEFPNIDKVLVFGYDPERDGLVISLANEEDIEYDDNE